MFASSQFLLRLERTLLEPRAIPLDPREGHDSEACRRLTAAVLLPQGRPGAWLLLLAASCTYVVIHAIALRLA